jgi:hypothetical protein
VGLCRSPAARQGDDGGCSQYRRTSLRLAEPGAAGALYAPSLRRTVPDPITPEGYSAVARSPRDSPTGTPEISGRHSWAFGSIKFGFPNLRITAKDAAIDLFECVGTAVEPESDLCKRIP